MPVNLITLAHFSVSSAMSFSEVGGRAATWFLQLTGLLVPLRSLGHLRTAAIVVV
jgi:hypothetical protein